MITRNAHLYNRSDKYISYFTHKKFWAISCSIYLSGTKGCDKKLVCYVVMRSLSLFGLHHLYAHKGFTLISGLELGSNMTSYLSFSMNIAPRLYIYIYIYIYMCGNWYILFYTKYAVNLVFGSRYYNDCLWKFFNWYERKQLRIACVFSIP